MISSLSIIKNNKNLLIIFLSFFLSQFYLWQSGLPQISHILLILGFFSFIFFNQSLYLGVSRSLVILIFYIILINVLWFLLVNDNEYLISTVYWCFNGLLFFYLTSLKIHDFERFKIIIQFLIFFSFVIQVFIWTLGFGEYKFSPRYNGLFNDPNQMAFWVLSCSSIFLLFCDVFYRRLSIIFLGFFLISLTMSRSAIIGFIMLIFAEVLANKVRLDKKVFYILLNFIIFIFIAILLYNFGFLDNLIARFNEGIAQKDEQAEERGFLVVSQNLQYILFGAGQGGYFLYNWSGREMHSTWLGILFYYGIIGFSLFISFLFNIFKGLSLSQKFLLLGPMLYGFTTYNARTIIFWFLLAFFLLFKIHSSKNRI